MKRSQPILILVSVAAVLSPVVYVYLSRSNPDVIYLHRDYKRFTQEINRKIPVGTDIRTARLLLIKSGLQCHVYPAKSGSSENEIRNAEQQARKAQLFRVHAQRREDGIIKRGWYADLIFNYGKCISVKTNFSQSKPFLD